MIGTTKKSLSESLLAGLAKRPPSGWYYLMPTGDFFFKVFSPSSPEGKVGGTPTRAWPVDTAAKESAWVACVEAKALEANPFRVKEALAKWRIELRDQLAFAERAGIDVLLDSSTYMAAFKDFTDLRRSSTGWGTSPIEAVADLLKQGFIPYSKAAA